MVIRRRLKTDVPGLAFITTTVKDWRPIYTNECMADIVIHQLKETANYYNVSVVSYCLMPSHLHLIIDLANINDLSMIIGSFKSLSARKLKALFGDYLKFWPGIEDSFHLWKPRFDDFIIRNRDQMMVKINYIHENPVRAKLVRNAIDWKCSSARDWLLNEKGLIEIAKDY